MLKPQHANLLVEAQCRQMFGMMHGALGQGTASLRSERKTECFQERFRESIAGLAGGTIWPLPQHGGFPADSDHCTAQHSHSTRPPLSTSTVHATGPVQN